MLYLANWLTAVLRSITLEHSCVALYLLVVTLAFLFISSFWRGKENLHRQQLSEPLAAVKLQRYFNHQTSSPGIVTYCHKPSDRISDLRDYFSKPKRDSRRQSYPEKSKAEFNFIEIRDKFQKMGEVNEFQMPFPDPPPPIQINPVESNLDKSKDVGELPKGERMFELRRIQHGDRAVSTGETAQQLEEFFTRDQNDTIRAPRSEGVQNELELLTRNRSVGNLLNTRFRTLLENSLRAPPQPTTRSTPSTRTGPLPPPPPPGAPRVPPAPPVPGAPPPNESTAARLERETVAAHMSQAALQAAEQYEPPDFANRQFDYAISDVEELFQRRLVSDVLHSTFRNVLELHIERRLVRAGVEPRPRAQAAPQPQPGASGQQAQPAINPFAGTPHVRPLVEPSSSRRIPEIERQIHVMSIEMKEMKGMLKLLVDTQLEMQRAVRQEVTAMMRSSTVEPAKPTKQVKEGTCVVCLEYPCDTVLYRCGHLCCCFSCARALKVAGHHCPVCRAEVSDILRIYRST